MTNANERSSIYHNPRLAKAGTPKEYPDDIPPPDRAHQLGADRAGRGGAMNALRLLSVKELRQLSYAVDLLIAVQRDGRENHDLVAHSVPAVV